MKKTIITLLFTLSIALLHAQMNVYCRSSAAEEAAQGDIGIVPKFPGGDSALQTWVAQNLLLDKKQSEIANGRAVRIAFVVDSNGVVGNVNIVTRSAAGPEADTLAAKLFCTMPAWIPGGPEANGKLVKKSAFRMQADVFYPVEQNGLHKPAYVALKPLAKIYNYKPSGKNDLIFTYAEQMPVSEYDFPDYLKKNVHYPAGTEQQGTVYVTFVVETDGSISNISVVKEVPGAPALTEEAIRVIREMPKWKPGKFNGRAVRVQVTQPIKFVMN